MLHFRKLLSISTLTIAVLASGCVKRVHFSSLAAARSGAADARVELTYNRNNAITVKLSDVPDPAEVNAKFTRYVLWVTTPDRRHIINIGQLRVENHRAELKTLTPLRRFVLFITTETDGDAMTPGPDVLFESKEISW